MEINLKKKKKDYQSRDECHVHHRYIELLIKKYKGLQLLCFVILFYFK